MPIYEYRCTRCHKTFEHFQKITDRPLEGCPDCRGKVERLISQTSFALRGGGWYKDGYATPKSGETNKDPKEKAPVKEKGKETKKETKKD